MRGSIDKPLQAKKKPGLGTSKRAPLNGNQNLRKLQEEVIQSKAQVRRIARGSAYNNGSQSDQNGSSIN